MCMVLSIFCSSMCGSRHIDGTHSCMSLPPIAQIVQASQANNADPSPSGSLGSRVHAAVAVNNPEVRARKAGRASSRCQPPHTRCNKICASAPGRGPARAVVGNPSAVDPRRPAAFQQRARGVAAWCSTGHKASGQHVGSYLFGALGICEQALSCKFQVAFIVCSLVVSQEIQ